MDYIKYALMAAVIWFIGSKIYEGFREGAAGNEARKHCMTCGTDAEAKVETRGSIFIELVLWLCLIIPGLIYSIWRLTSKRSVCPACGGTSIVPYASPAAVAHRQQLTQSVAIKG